MASTLDALERRGVAYTGWQYKSYAGSLPNGTCTGCGNSFFEDSGAANGFMLAAMARPMAHAVAGDPVPGRAAAGAVVVAATPPPPQPQQQQQQQQQKQEQRFELSLLVTGEGPTEIVVPHLWLPEVDVTVAGDDAAVALQTPHAGSQVAPGVTNAGWTMVAVKHSPASKGKVVTITIAAPAAAR